MPWVLLDDTNTGGLRTQGPFGPKPPGGGPPKIGRRLYGDAPPMLPTATAVGITNLTATSVTLVGSINTEGLEGTYWFQYGTTTSVTSLTTSVPIDSGTLPASVQVGLTGLMTGVEYYFDVVVYTAGGLVVSPLLSFVPAVPGTTVTTVSTSAGTAITNISIPHFEYPFTVTLRGVEVTQQDSDQDVSSCVQAILNCTVGQWPENPNFGFPDLAFSQGPPSPEGITASILRWEPRATESAVVTYGSDDGTWGVQLQTEAQ